MTHYFVAYDLTNATEDRYAQLHDAIQKLGPAVHMQYSVFYVRSALPLKDVYDRLTPYINKDEKLLVIEASNAIGKGHGKDWERLIAVWQK